MASGKTTLAKEICKKNQAFLLSEDEFMEKLASTYYNEDLKYKIVNFLKEIATNLLKIGVNVVMDGGYWSKIERDELRNLAKNVNANFELHFLDTPLEILKKRAEARNFGLAEEFQTKIEDIDIAWKKFEKPLNENAIFYKI